MRRLFPVFALLLSPLVQAQEDLAPYDAALVVASSTASIDATGDFNADGHVDGVGWWWLNTYKSQVRLAIWLGDGRGAFQESWYTLPTTSSNAASWNGIAVGDLDGRDGDDFALALVQQVLAFTTTRSGTAQQIAAWTEPIFVQRLLAADFDADGRDDLVVAGALGSTAEVKLYRNTGSGFALASTFAGAADAYLAELDGDGQKDLVVPGTGTLQLLLVKGGALVPGAVYTHGVQPGEQPMYVPGDIDGDGDDDIVVFAAAGTYVTLRRTGASSFTVEPRATGGPATGLADLDGDGDLDGTCCGGGGPSPVPNVGPSTFHLSVNDGQGAFAPAFQIPGMGAKHLAGALDLDHDGDTDLIAGRAVLFNRDSFRIDPRPAVPYTANPAVIADLDGDGDPDRHWTASALQRNDGAGWLALGSIVAPAPPAGTFYGGPGILGDFDGDSDLDLIVGHTQQGTVLGMRLWRNTSGGGFVDGGYAAAPGVNFNPSGGAYRFGDDTLVHDADGDGDQDVLAGTRIGLSAIQVWLNDGSGFFTAGQRVFPAYVPFHAGDIDGDGLLDLATGSASGVRVLWGAAPGTFGASWSASVKADIAGGDRIAVADYDGDGRLDFAAGDGTTKKVNLWLQQPGRSFVPNALAVGFASSFGTWRCLATDADLDGKPDLIVHPEATATTTAAVLLGDARGGFRSTSLQIVDALELADADGDGDEDLLGSTLARSAARRVPAHGFRQQYGAARAGLGGMAPTIGARGPFRAGGTCELRLTGAPGATIASFAFGLGRASLADWPLPGLTSYAQPFLAAIPLPAGGTAGAPGTGTVKALVQVPASVAGQAVFLQVHVLDQSLPGWLGQTNGLELRF